MLSVFGRSMKNHKFVQLFPRSLVMGTTTGCVGDDVGEHYIATKASP